MRHGDAFACGAVEYGESLFGADITWLDLSDDPVSVAIPQTPGIYEYFGEEGLANVFTVTAQQSSLTDGVLPYDTEAAPIYAALPGEKSHLVLDYRGH